MNIMAIRNVSSRPPSSNDHIADKMYVDSQISSKYTKPGAGIPKSDLASGVQSSLNKADAAITTSSPKLYKDYLQIDSSGSVIWDKINPSHISVQLSEEFNSEHISLSDFVHDFSKSIFLTLVAIENLPDFTTIGRNLATASTQANARSAIGAGTSSLALGSTSSTAMAGNKKAKDIQGVESYSGQQNTVWRGTQAEYDALAVETRNAAGFIAFIRD